MEDEAKKSRNDYFKEYRKQNKDKIKKINDRYWEKKAKENEKIK